MPGGEIKSFRDIEAWKQGHRLVLIIYRLTKNFPKDEQFGLTIQVRRAVVSITSNIAEGFSRNTYKDKLHFYSIGLGSLSEVQNQLFIAKELNYLNDDEYKASEDISISVSKLLHGLIKKTRQIIQNS